MAANYHKQIIILGKAGNGKSSLGNSLLGKQAFHQARSFNAVTEQCRLESNDDVSVVDTPGFFGGNGERSLQQQALDIQRAMQLCPNPHAFLLVLNGCSRLTADELKTLLVFQIIFGEQCLEKAIIVLTHIENNISHAKLQEMLEESSEISLLLGKYKGRLAGIDNTDLDHEHTNYIFSLVDEISRNGKESFQNEYIHVNKRVLQEALEHDETGPFKKMIERWSERIREDIEREKNNKKMKEMLGTGAVCVGLAALGGLAIAKLMEEETPTEDSAALATRMVVNAACIPSQFTNNAL